MPGGEFLTSSWLYVPCNPGAHLFSWAICWSGDVDWAYVIAGLAVPAATFCGLRLWFVRSRAAAVQADTDQAEPGLARSVAALQDRLGELSGQLETMSRDWEDRDLRLKGQLSELLAFTEQMARIDPWIRERSGENPGAQKSPRL
jgi:hypothetical protein